MILKNQTMITPIAETLLTYNFCFFHDEENLVPNVTAEVYFVVQLLTARGIAHESRQEEIDGNKILKNNTALL